MIPYRSIRDLSVFITVAWLTWLCGCDEGLSPAVQRAPTGSFGGVVRFSNWQAADSIYDIRLVAFRTFPPTNLIGEVQSGNAVVYPPIGSGPLVSSQVDSLLYLVTVPALTYKYVVVAQQYGPDVYSQWKPVGQYDLDSNLTVPSPVVVTPNDTTTGVDIIVDFAHPPPPPF